MAKMFYTEDEVQQKLGKSKDQIKSMIASGQLREFRDGQKIMYKVDDVDALAGPGDTGDIGLLPEDSAENMALSGKSDAPLGLGGDDGPIGLAGDTKAGGGDLINLASESGSSVGLVPGDSADQISLDDTGEAIPSKDDTVITKHGVNVLDDSDGELELADPMAQTQIAPDLDEHIHLDSGSSGSGLLDLTREADDTSLGAELLDEIYPGADEAQVETQIPTQLDVPSSVATSGAMMDSSGQVALADYTRVVQVVDPLSGAFGAMLVVPLLALVYLAFVASCRMMGAEPPFMGFLAEGFNVWYCVGGAIVVSVIILLVGQSLLGKSGRPKTAMPKKPSPAKAKKGK